MPPCFRGDYMADKFILVEKEKTQWQKQLEKAIEAPEKVYIINPKIKLKPADPWEPMPYVKPKD